MKILRKGNDFMKMKDGNLNDVIKINTMTERGWTFCSKKEYKQFFNKDKNDKVETTDTTEVVEKPKKEKKEKKQKEVKDSKKDKKSKK